MDGSASAPPPPKVHGSICCSQALELHPSGHSQLGKLEWRMPIKTAVGEGAQTALFGMEKWGLNIAALGFVGTDRGCFGLVALLREFSSTVLLYFHLQCSSADFQGVKIPF